jgi:hypothetical protein
MAYGWPCNRGDWIFIEFFLRRGFLLRREQGDLPFYAAEPARVVEGDVIRIS